MSLQVLVEKMGLPEGFDDASRTRDLLCMLNVDFLHIYISLLTLVLELYKRHFLMVIKVVVNGGTKLIGVLLLLSLTGTGNLWVL